MFRDEVIAHYAGRGYTVHESVQLRGETGRVHPCDIVAEGPLGNLVVTVRDSGGATELASLRAKGKDLSATPVLAVPDASPDIRRAAMQMGIAVLQAADLTAPEPEPEPVAWPAPAREPAARQEASLWTTTRTASAQALVEPEPPEAAGPWDLTARTPATGEVSAGTSAQAPVAESSAQAPAQAPSGSWLAAINGEAVETPDKTARAPLRSIDEVTELVDDMDVAFEDLDEPEPIDATELPPRPALQSERETARYEQEAQEMPAKKARGARRRVTAAQVVQVAVGGIVAGLVVFGLAVAFL